MYAGKNVFTTVLRKKIIKEKLCLQHVGSILAAVKARTIMHGEGIELRVSS